MTDAGRALDYAVAEQVFGWKRGKRWGNGNGEWIFPQGETYFRNDWDGTPNYSTDIAAAWSVVEKLAKNGHNLTMRQYAYHRTYASFGAGDWEDLEFEEGNGEYCTPEAICLAAMKAVGGVR